MNNEEAAWQAFRDNLAYYIVDALSAEEKADMDAFISAHPRAQAELEAERRLQRALHAEAEKVQVDVEAGVARLLRELKSEARGAGTVQAGGYPSESSATRIRRWLDRLGTVRVAAVAASLLIAQAITIALLIPGQALDPAPVFRGTGQATADTAHFKLYPDGDSVYADLAELLIVNGCTLVHGPDADGAVQVHCSADTQQSRQQAEAALRASTLIADVTVLRVDGPPPN